MKRERESYFGLFSCRWRSLKYFRKMFLLWTSKTTKNIVLLKVLFLQTLFFSLTSNIETTQAILLLLSWPTNSSWDVTRRDGKAEGGREKWRKSVRNYYRERERKKEGKKQTGKEKEKYSPFRYGRKQSSSFADSSPKFSRFRQSQS